MNKCLITILASALSGIIVYTTCDLISIAFKVHKFDKTLKKNVIEVVDEI